jgi:hypothetical protein
MLWRYFSSDPSPHIAPLRLTFLLPYPDGVHVMSSPEPQPRHYLILFFTFPLYTLEDIGFDSFESFIHPLHRMHSFWGSCIGIAHLGFGVAIMRIIQSTADWN